MTQEEKAKAYDEALNQAKFYHGNCPSEPERKKLEKMFPVLCESEDERIRKRLIEYFEGFRMGNAEVKWEGLTVQEVLAWLEKRKETGIQWLKSDNVKNPDKPYVDKAGMFYTTDGRMCYASEIEKRKEQKPDSLIYDKDLDKAAREFYLSGGADSPFDSTGLVPIVRMAEFGATWMKERMEKEQKPVEHSAKGRRGRMGGIPEYVRRKAEAFKDKMEPPYDADDICTAYEAGALESAKPAELEQLAKLREMTHEIRDAYERGIEVGHVESKQEWSEEDEERLKAICTYLQDYPRLAKINDVKRFNEYCDWLKSLPERFNLEPKEGWNEEDEENMQAIVETIKRHWLTLPGNTLIDWLKSLRPVSKESLQSHWKPSEEQMDAVKHAYNSFPNDCSTKSNLRFLYHDLEKLGVREEPEYYQHFDPDC